MKEKLTFLTKNKIFIGGLIIVLFAAYFIHFAQAANFESLKDTLSDSDRGAVATHVFIASTTETITADGYLEVVFPADFTTISTTTVVCPTGGVAGGSGQTIRCTFASELTATYTQITVPGVTNPNTVGSYLINVYTKQSGGTVIESGSLRVAITNDVSVTATVNPSLTFEIWGLATTSPINDGYTAGSSTAQTIPFGTLTVDTEKTMGQQLRVTTNAAGGYTVTVFQDHNLWTSGGADIDSFKDGSPSTPEAWAAPTATLGSEATYGHFGLTANDSSLSGGDTFGSFLHRGFTGSTPLEVMYHTGAADGATDHIGSSTVGYTIEVSSLQEAGDYYNTLTYICTPTY